MKPLFAVLALLFLVPMASADSLGLPDDFDPDPAIPTPAEVFGFEMGELHPRHDQIAGYLEALAEASDRVELEVIGQSHGRRDLMLLTFVSPDRRDQLNAIRASRLADSRSGEGPVVLWMGYNVHGNEPSAASAAVVAAWYLAADRSERTRAWLDEMVIVIDPVMNPDGLDRFAHWVNSHRGRHPSADSDDREHREAWPNGRTNYYWFDLNRDWLPLVHPESRARVAQTRQWRPHVMTDYHEMGTNTTYFFQPGVPERTNPLTPTRNQALTARLGEFHARALDAAGESFFTRELFDDYYIGKGSTYPDMTGGIGILFEQASARGHVQDRDYGRLTFREAIANQVRTSLSTFDGTFALRDELIDYQREFFATGRELASNAGHAGWVFGDDGDRARGIALVDLLLAHGIEVRPVAERISINGKAHSAGSAWAVPADQDQYRFLSSTFDPVDELPMETFYDVSTWPLAQAFDLPLTTLRRLPELGEALSSAPPAVTSPVTTESPAWLVAWDQYRAPALLAQLLSEGYRVQVSSDILQARTDQGEVQLPRGSLVIAAGLQDDERDPVAGRLQALSAQYGVEVLAARSGLSLSGPDLGSPSVPVLTPPKVAMVVGNGVRANHAGYIWHWFDRRLDLAMTQIEHNRVGEVDLSDYTHLILPDGSYGSWDESVQEALIDYVLGGGTLIAARNASAWVESLDLDFDFIESEDEGDDQPAARRAYADHDLDFARTLIGGSALNINLDITHPLAWGYQRPELVVFRRGRHGLKASDNAYVHVGMYEESPLAGGYLSDATAERLSETPALVATRHGRGVVVRMADDFLFRGYWIGAERLFANALFFADQISRTDLPSD
ncbi:MAG: M14 family zinc carboxypeptidase [Pseudomonadota bacterium]